MKIGVLNIREDLYGELDKLYDVVYLDDNDDEVDCIFIDWVPKDYYGFTRQAEIVEEYVRKKTPTVIFDRYLSMSYKEWLWLKRFAVYFFEPAINNRIGFTYIPQWTSPLQEDWDKNYRDIERYIDLLYDGDISNKVASFEKYYKEYATLFPDRNVVCSIPFKKDYENYNIKFMTDDIKATEVKSIVLIGSVTDYRIGYLPDATFLYMKKGILPLLPVEHRFFGSMFRHMVIENEKDIDYLLVKRNGVRYAMIEDIFDNMEKYHPEFKVDYVVEKTKFYLKV